jgi:hypothetical protein
MEIDVCGDCRCGDSLIWLLSDKLICMTMEDTDAPLSNTFMMKKMSWVD